MTFTDVYISNLKTEKRMEDFIEGDGFGCRVYATGGKTFFYRYEFDGKRRFLNLGVFDPKFEMTEPNGKKLKSLAYFRKLYIEARNQVLQGNDPLMAKEQARTARKKTPFMSDFCVEYIERHAKRNKKSWQLDEALIKREILPHWSKRKITDIDSRDVLALLNAIGDRGAPKSENRVKSLVSMMFSCAVSWLYVKENPCRYIKKEHRETPRTRMLDYSEIKQLWNALDGDEVIMTEQTRNMLKIILLTCQRPGEVAAMHESEISGHWWTIPSGKTKNKKEHQVYLSNMALTLIGDYQGRGYIFPSGVENRHQSVGSLAFALRRNIKGQSVVRDKIARRKGEEYKRGAYNSGKPLPEDPNRLGMIPFTPHDLRRSGASLMASIRIPFETRERVLNHSLSQMDDVYNHYDYREEKQAAMEALERKIIAITTETECNVIDMSTRQRRAA